MKKFFILIVIVAATSCSRVMGDKSFGNHLVLVHDIKAIVYCADESKPCSDGIHLVENVEDYKSNHDWIIARTDKDGRKYFWAINKDFSLGEKDCKTTDCGSYIRTFVNGPLSYEDFVLALDEWDVGMNLPRK